MTYLFVDIVFCLILIISVIFGIKKGAVKIFLSLVSIVFATVITYLLGSTVTTNLYIKFVEPSITDKIFTSIRNGNFSEDILPKFITKNADTLGIELNKLQITNSLTREDIANFVEDNVSKTVCSILNIAVSAVIFIVAMLLTKIILRLFNKLVKYSYLGGINSVLGSVVGAVNGLVIIMILCFLLSYLFKHLSVLPSFISEESVNNSLFYRIFLYIF